MAEALLRDQAELQRWIANMPSDIKSHVEKGNLKPTAELIDNTISHLGSHWTAYKENHSKLKGYPDITDNEYLTADHFFKNECSYLQGLGILSELKPSTVLDSSTAVTTASSALRESLPPLPSVPLPEFSGSYLEWESFRDIFEGLVVNRTDVPDVQKLLLLKRVLKGEAALLVNNIATTAANFQGAWNAVCSRYRNERLLVQAHLSTIFDLPTIQKVSARDMRHLIDRTNDELRALRHLGRPVDHWDDILVFLLLRRLDPISRREWEMHLSATDNAKALADPEYQPTQPTFEQLEQFFESRIRALEMSTTTSSTMNKEPRLSKGNTSSRSPSGKSTMHRSHQASIGQQKFVCTFCGDHHSNFSCSTFREKTAHERLSEAKRLRVCLNCLVPHQGKPCTSKKTCVKCKQTHNTLLHDALQVHSESVASPSTAQTASAATPSSAAMVSSHFVRDETPRTIALLTTALVTIQMANLSKPGHSLTRAQKYPSWQKTSCKHWACQSDAHQSKW